MHRNLFFQEILNKIENEVQTETQRGQTAKYIPALAHQDLSQFAMAVHTIDGQEFQVGSASQFFSIQSIAKVISLTLALKILGKDLWQRVGVEPSGSAFNSLV